MSFKSSHPPQDYKPSFVGKRYSMQLVNLAVRNLAKNEEHTPIENFNIRTKVLNLIFT